ncbi:MAG: hypothetical protein R3320_08800 [Nitriliruptorales bacterium]|nr:hypothetical protein [Nitriliruptorales bacterium]
MTMSMPPHMPGSRRAIPTTLREDSKKRLRALLEQGEVWVLRPDWEAYLREGHDRGIQIDDLPRGHQIAARAWLSQQRHVLYQRLEGDERAPEGWLESLPLYQALNNSEPETGRDWDPTA